MMQNSESDDFSTSDYEAVDIENSGFSVCILIEDDCSLIETMYSAPIKEIPEVSQKEKRPDTSVQNVRIVGLREAGLSYRAVAARVQRNSSTIMRVSKQWTDEGRTARKSVSGSRNVTSAREDRRLVRMAQTDHTAFSRQLAAQWSTATRVSLCALSIRRRLLQRGLRTRIPLYRIPLTQNHRRLRLHWANVHRSWRADWQQVVFSDKSRFNLCHHDGRIRVRLYAGERRIPECIIERHSGRTPGVMVWGAIAYHG
ncbi:transposable element Tc1 transposase [Trichonephila clavipes]|nr:transposable element Tc1 transposase [Trichonephila clavipes]